MILEYQIIAAVALDLILGDPKWLPHPVKLIGLLAQGLEKFFLRHIKQEKQKKTKKQKRLAGFFTALSVILITGITVFLLIYCARRLHPFVGDVISIIMLYTTLAVRDLLHHSISVYRFLKVKNINGARRSVSMMVGRDTENLDETGVIRATVESVSENIVDGITSPLFYAVLGGPVAAVVYKSINTLDSMFGYKNEKYKDFGWTSARIDDVANFIPARLTAPLIVTAATLLRYRPLTSLKILFRDRKKHPSPNSGITEAAVAGALGIQLGGLNYYFGQGREKPKLGDPRVELKRNHILSANAIVLVTSCLAVITFLWAKYFFNF